MSDKEATALGLVRGPDGEWWSREFLEDMPKVAAFTRRINDPRELRRRWRQYRWRHFITAWRFIWYGPTA